MKKLANDVVVQTIVELIMLVLGYLASYLNGGSIDKTTLLWIIIFLLIGLLLILYAKIKVLADATLERTNYFHWMYNYRFKQLKGVSGFSMQDKNEFDFMVEEISSKYKKKSREEILKMLKPHYDKLVAEELKKPTPA